MKALTITMLLAVAALAQDAAKKAPARPGLTLTTTAFADGAEIPAKYTQSDPKPISPDCSGPTSRTTPSASCSTCTIRIQRRSAKSTTSSTGW